MLVSSKKCGSRKHDDADPQLSNSLGLFVDQAKYSLFLASNKDQNEISRCSSFSSIEQANGKRHKGCRSQGIGATSCSRHEYYLCLGDLLKGEAYSPMDYILLTVLASTLLMFVTISYDIACQYYCNFFPRMETMPEGLQIPSWCTLRFRIPKLHLVGHIPICRPRFSFNYTPKSGVTDGEGVERQWSWLNSIAPSVSMMRAGGRWDALNDFCNYWNWSKTVGLRTSLKKKMVSAIPWAIIHHRAFEAFTKGLRVNHSDFVSEWEKQVSAWELNPHDMSVPCPFDLPESEQTLAKLRKEYAKRKRSAAKEVEGSNDDDQGPLESREDLMLHLIEAERYQQLLNRDVNTKSKGLTKEKNIHTRRTSLIRRISHIRETQSTYMPFVTRLLQEMPNVDRSTPEKLPLFFPSSLDAARREKVPELCKIEEEIREAQCGELLSKLRAQLRTRQVAYMHTSRTAIGHKHWTESRELQQTIELRIVLLRAQYENARKHCLALRGPGDWQNVYRELKGSDVRSISERALSQEEKAVLRAAQLQAGVSVEEVNEMLDDDISNIPTVTFDPILALGQSKRTLSWIWYTASGSEVLEDNVNESLRVEWCKARARAQRYREELELIDEEMGRAIAFTQSRADWWLKQIGLRQSVTAEVRDGLEAYGREQSAIEKERAMVWEEEWLPVRIRARGVIAYLDGTGEIPAGSLNVELEDEDNEYELDDDE
ncbi:hypothetical protein BT96DRAFT_1006633 [Gymnopus androsaceus JB14]|uniref:CxC1-like cysteine cluster associated with KDZ transposases domain-containing protein n=1 Tax=Gymnopus androsaceus JB14 TaxID=1447944 RepID=A0A6A4GKE9_9AGAR|nr:hypothetical protein BT96DRAFT_1006633 [Gymnopus androsaceus JB14]